MFTIIFWASVIQVKVTVTVAKQHGGGEAACPVLQTDSSLQIIHIDRKFYSTVPRLMPLLLFNHLSMCYCASIRTNTSSLFHPHPPFL